MSRTDFMQQAAARKARRMSDKPSRAKWSARRARRRGLDTGRWRDARERVTPLLGQTRETVTDAYERMRHDYVPIMSEAVGDAAKQMAVMSEPYRREAAARGTAALAGLRGDITAQEIARIARRRRRRWPTMMIVVGAMGAAAAGGMLWWRRQTPSWVVDEGADASTQSNRDASVPDSMANRATKRAHEAADKVKEAAARVGDRAKGSKDDSAAQGPVGKGPGEMRGGANAHQPSRQSWP